MWQTTLPLLVIWYVCVFFVPVIVFYVVLYMYKLYRQILNDEVI